MLQLQQLPPRAYASRLKSRQQHRSCRLRFVLGTTVAAATPELAIFIRLPSLLQQQFLAATTSYRLDSCARHPGFTPSYDDIAF